MTGATYTDTFTGTDGSAPSAAWTLTNATGASQSIQGNRLRQISGSTAGTAASARFNRNTAIIDFEIAGTVEFMTSVDSYALIAFRGDTLVANRGIPTNGYVVQFTSGAINLFGVVAGTPTLLATATILGTGGSVLTFRIRVVGSTIQVKAYGGSDTTAGAYDITTTETTYTSGFVSIGTESTPSGSQEMRWDDVTISFLNATPFKVQDIGTATTSAGALTTVLNYTGTFKPGVGDLVVVYGSRDNITNDPATGDSFTDNHSNTYSRPSPLAQPSGTSTASAGIVGVAFYSILTTAWTGDQTLTWAHPSTIAAMQIEHWANVSGLRGSNSAGSAAGAPSVAITSPIRGDAVLGMEAIEYSAVGTTTGDADTTNGSWSAVSGPTTTAGTTLAAVKVVSQWKIVTADGTQTFNPTHSVTASVDAVAIVLDFIPAKVMSESRYVYKHARARAANW